MEPTAWDLISDLPGGVLRGDNWEGQGPTEWSRGRGSEVSRGGAGWGMFWRAHSSREGRPGRLGRLWTLSAAQQGATGRCVLGTPGVLEPSNHLAL